MSNLNYPEGMPIQAKMINRAIESAQTKIEGLNFDARKYTLEYDDVLNKQRKAFYNYRDQILQLGQEKNVLKEIENILEKNLEELIKLPIENLEALLKELKIIEGDVDLKTISESDLYNFIFEKTKEAFIKIKNQIGGDVMEQISKSIILNILDNLWTQHLENLEYLREVVRLRAYGQHDPLVEYKTNAYQLFKDFFKNFDEMLFEIIFQLKKPQMTPVAEEVKPSLPVDISPEKFKNVGRNDPCPCGSGKKFKKCHGR